MKLKKLLQLILLAIILLSSCYQRSKIYYTAEERHKLIYYKKASNSIYRNLHPSYIRLLNNLYREGTRFYTNDKGEAIEYLPKEKKLFYIKQRQVGNNYESDFYTRLVVEDEEKLFKKFNKQINNFVLNNTRSKIYINLPNNEIELYNFPSFKYIKKFKGNHLRYNSEENKMYYVAGGKLYSLSNDGKEELLYSSKYKICKYILRVKSIDILIVTEQKSNIYESLFKGWDKKYKVFLLSNPSKILRIGGDIKTIFNKKRNRKLGLWEQLR